jgi:hypothetical protein
LINCALGVEYIVDLLLQDILSHYHAPIWCMHFYYFAQIDTYRIYTGRVVASDTPENTSFLFQRNLILYNAYIYVKDNTLTPTKVEWGGRKYMQKKDRHKKCFISRKWLYKSDDDESLIT